MRCPGTVIYTVLNCNINHSKTNQGEFLLFSSWLATRNRKLSLISRKGLDLYYRIFVLPAGYVMMINGGNHENR